MPLQVKSLTKQYNGLSVLQNISLTLEGKTIYCLTGPSGSGKTTFFRILLGLEAADSGTIHLPEKNRFSAVFQEDRLCETFSPVDNTALVLPGPLSRSRPCAARELARLLPEESLRRPVSTLSGGMKRRCAICRALLAPSDIILMDEPFTGLDEETRHRVISYVLEKSADKLVIISTHQEEDIDLLHGKRITLF